MAAGAGPDQEQIRSWRRISSRIKSRSRSWSRSGAGSGLGSGSGSGSGVGAVAYQELEQEQIRIRIRSSCRSRIPLAAAGLSSGWHQAQPWACSCKRSQPLGINSSVSKGYKQIQKVKFHIPLAGLSSLLVARGLPVVSDPAQSIWELQERHRNVEVIPRGMALLLCGCCLNLFSFISYQLLFVSITTSQIDKGSLGVRFLLGNMDKTQLS